MAAPVGSTSTSQSSRGDTDDLGDADDGESDEVGKEEAGDAPEPAADAPAAVVRRQRRSPGRVRSRGQGLIYVRV